MNADVSKPAETIWAYLHGELSEAERLSLEADVARDPALRFRFEEARRLDRLLGSALPSLDAAEAGLDALADLALAAWECEQTPAFQARLATSSRRKTVVFPAWTLSLRRPAWGVAGLAAAAALTMLVSPLLRETPETAWARPTFSPLALRGTNGSAAATLPADTAVRCQKVLASALARAFEERGAVPRNGLTLTFRLQELCKGAFSVTVQAHDRSQRIVGEWRGDYTGVQSFLKQANASAAQMMAVLAVSGEDAVSGGQP